MLKRIFVGVFALVLLLSGIAPARALTKEEVYNAALDTLSSYINSEMDDIDLYMLRDNFSALSNYRSSFCFLLYVNVLIELEKEDAQEASEESDTMFNIRIYFDTMRSDALFVKFLAEDERFRSIDALENYYYGRQAEKKGEPYEAFNYYKNADSYKDSVIRMHALSNELYSDQYTQALTLFDQGKYEEAYRSFEEIYSLGYTQCEGMMMLAKRMWESTKPKEHVWLAATCTTPETCEVCLLTREPALGHDWQEAACERSRICKRCGADEGIAREHDWAPATCTSPRTCKLCYKTDGRALDHDWIDASCEKAQYCSRCKITTGNPKGHDWSEATCEKESTCRNCGATRGSKAAHVWSDATCEMASTCYNCGATRGSKAAHDWMSATCQRRQTCRNCGATTGSYGDHQWQSATYSNPRTCKICGLTSGDPLKRPLSVNDFGFGTRSMKPIKDIATRTGPGNDYTALPTYPKSLKYTGYYKTNGGSVNWVYVEFTYKNQKYRLYTGEQRFSNSSAVPNSNEDYTYATVSGSIHPYYGPGYDYAQSNFEKAVSGMRVKAFFRENDWVMIEYTISDGLIHRGWVPSSYLS